MNNADLRLVLSRKVSNYLADKDQLSNIYCYLCTKQHKNMLTEKYRQLSNWQEKGHHPQPMTQDQNAVTTHCKNCGTSFQGSFCPNCGQTANVRRLSFQQAAMDFINIFTNFDSGLFHTCMELCYRPGHMMRDFLNGHRREYVKPVQLAFLLGTIMLLLHYILYGNGFETDVDTDSLAHKVDQHYAVLISDSLQWLWANHTILYLCMGAVLVVPNYFIFRLTQQGKKMNLIEHLYIMIYVTCQLMMLDIAQMPIERFVTNSNNFNLGIPLLLLVYDFHQLYSISYRKSVLLSLLSNLTVIGAACAVVFAIIYMADAT